jgi:hypothetical protein
MPPNKTIESAPCVRVIITALEVGEVGQRSTVPKSPISVTGLSTATTRTIVAHTRMSSQTTVNSLPTTSSRPLGLWCMRARRSRYRREIR